VVPRPIYRGRMFDIEIYLLKRALANRNYG
jgi:hypothetical protein